MAVLTFPSGVTRQRSAKSPRIPTLLRQADAFCAEDGDAARALRPMTPNASRVNLFDSFIAGSSQVANRRSDARLLVSWHLLTSLSCIASHESSLDNAFTLNSCPGLGV